MKQLFCIAGWYLSLGERVCLRIIIENKNRAMDESLNNVFQNDRETSPWIAKIIDGKMTIAQRTDAIVFMWIATRVTPSNTEVWSVFTTLQLAASHTLYAKIESLNIHFKHKGIWSRSQLPDKDAVCAFHPLFSTFHKDTLSFLYDTFLVDLNVNCTNSTNSSANASSDTIHNTGDGNQRADICNTSAIKVFKHPLSLVANIFSMGETTVRCDTNWYCPDEDAVKQFPLLPKGAVVWFHVLFDVLMYKPAKHRLGVRYAVERVKVISE